MKKVAIIGAGELGCGIAHILKDTKVVTHLCDNRQGLHEDQKPAEEALRNAPIVFVCVPSWCLRDALVEHRSFIQKKALIVTFSKGLEKGTQYTPRQVVYDLFPKHPYAAIVGPMLAEEFSQGKRGAAVVATKQRRSFGKINKVFKNTLLEVFHSSDVRGVLLAGVLKNVYALGMGLGDALSWGANEKAIAMVKAIHEMEGIIQELGGRRKTAFTYAGLGDLIATGFSDYSSNLTAGKQLVHAGEAEIKSEGLMSLASLNELLGKKTQKYPFFEAISSIVLHKKKAHTVYKQYGLIGE